MGLASALPRKKERTRIAGEPHVSLLQGFQGSEGSAIVGDNQGLAASRLMRILCKMDAVHTFCARCVGQRAPTTVGALAQTSTSLS
jgi:hypothetical protein